MRVLLAIPWKNVHPTGGVNVIVRTLGRYFHEAGDQVAYLATGEGTAVEKTALDGNTLFRVPMRRPPGRSTPLRGRLAYWLYFPLTAWRIAAILRRAKIQIVNLHFLMDTWLYFMFLRRLLRFQVVLSLHGSDVMGPDGPRNLRLLASWSNTIDCLILCSEAFREQTISPRSPLWTKSVVILNGLDPSSIPCPRSSNSTRPSVTCVAHLQQHKAPDLLLRAFREIAEEFPTLQLDFVGDGPLREHLESLARDWGIAHRVRFWGDVPREKALSLIASAKVFCLPSKRESFGLVVLEAMFSGVPVVATRVGGIPEIVRQEIDGLLVEPDAPDALAAALRRVLKEDSLREKLIHSAKQRALETFHVNRFVLEYREKLLQLLKGS